MKTEESELKLECQSRCPGDCVVLDIHNSYECKACSCRTCPSNISRKNLVRVG
jgi:hypothetical protein